ncbi:MULTISPECIES: M23 family metallopeptidase [unclassified Streptomyces]|uniref:M23 family metallopeptidase n=1 Tax=unclassified Streptomyces TaxID=2593676 RepID=UPI002DD7C906|nr:MULTISPECIES: M23 family metallopeptidase [unclassified Streptomyces]WSA97219.1 M23 family metallopeptidase [Streptomyces sp. NBC_01795]WSB81649.1 M23 family metallopeptidase [Streptomyces sp. NBC_01775]WSS17590.1 M23 family metallopeptidase [Streptomyces sp. NBC_01186]WSS46340.1 M23 family metallopeptidase [Streptomyces sp. NBC_01187]
MRETAGAPEAYGPHEAYGPRDKAGNGTATWTGNGPGAGTGTGDEAWEEWNPTEESLRPLRGRHRVGKQRSGGVARSGAVLGVGMIAAVGAGGMATAQDKDPAAISMPDVSSATGAVKNLPEHLPDAKQLPGVGDLISDGDSDGTDPVAAAAAHAPLTQAGLSADEAAEGKTDAGEALRVRILAQAEQQQSEADATARQEAAQQAAEKAAAAAKKQVAADKKAAAERKREAAEEKKRKAAAERRAKLAREYTAPLASFQLSAGFGQAGGMWQSDHTGQDFAAPNGTPVKAIHSGTIKEAGWAGSYGYRIVLKLNDGTELWFCHLSSMTKSAGDKVGTGDVIGRVGSTGNSSGPHLHVEVRPGGGDPVAPLPWLRDKGVNV